MKRNAIFFLLISFVTALYAQSNMQFRDKAGDVVGTLVQFVEQATSCGLNPVDRPLISCKAVMRQSKVFMEIDLITGELNGTNTWFTEQTCGGNPYVREDDIGQRGGLLYAIRGAGSAQLARVDWYPAFSNTSLESYKGLDGLCFNSRQNYSATPVVIDDATMYELKIIESNDAPGMMGLGFLPPLSPEVHHHEIIFCNGLENCPVD